jgi:hypothetical protein
MVTIENVSPAHPKVVSSNANATNAALKDVASSANDSLARAAAISNAHAAMDSIAIASPVRRNVVTSMVLVRHVRDLICVSQNNVSPVRRAGTTTFTVRVAKMAKKAVRDGGMMVREAMPMKVLDTCVEKARHAETAHHATVTKLVVIDVQKVRRMAMAPAVNVGLAQTVRRTRPVPAPINPIRRAHPRSQQKEKAT